MPAPSFVCTASWIGFRTFDWIHNQLDVLPPIRHLFRLCGRTLSHLSIHPTKAVFPSSHMFILYHQSCVTPSHPFIRSTKAVYLPPLCSSAPPKLQSLPPLCSSAPPKLQSLPPLSSSALPKLQSLPPLCSSTPPKLHISLHSVHLLYQSCNNAGISMTRVYEKRNAAKLHQLPALRYG